MRVLIVSATPLEAMGITHDAAGLKAGETFTVDENTELLISGVGQAISAFHLGRHLERNKYDLAINIGICGSFNKDIKPGTVIGVESDCFFDLGAEDDKEWLSIFQMGLLGYDQYPFINGLLIPGETGYFQQLLKVKGITVNRATGNEDTIKRILDIYDAEVETMEGASFYYACLQHQLPAIQVRAVSNYIEKRNRDNWQMEIALTNLHETLSKTLSELNSRDV
ncbi:MAG: futalosine hydrolase [Bacteroidota bacterium]